MPPFNPKTIIQSGNKHLFYTRVLNDLFYYNSDVMDNVCDFNVTFEILGSNSREPYLPQKLWIVSNKAMRILIKEFDYRKKDFIPVVLVDEKNEVGQ